MQVPRALPPGAGCRALPPDAVLSVKALRCMAPVCCVSAGGAHHARGPMFVTGLVWSRAIQIGKYTTTRRILYELLSIDFNILSQYKYTIYIYIGAEMRTDH